LVEEDVAPHHAVADEALRTHACVSVGFADAGDIVLAKCIVCAAAVVGAAFVYVVYFAVG
jgi:hypothetical protein